jgi:hypothetical protein
VLLRQFYPGPQAICFILWHDGDRRARFRTGVEKENAVQLVPAGE